MNYITHDFNASTPRVTVRPPAISARGLGNRKLNKAKRALLAADVISGRASLEKLTLKLVSEAFGISVAYLSAALRCTPEERAAIEKGRRPLIPTPEAKFPSRMVSVKSPLPPVIDWNLVDDTALVDAVRSIGVDRVIGAAVVAERSVAVHT